LTQLPGLGRWTATSVALTVHGDPDVVIEGDYGIPALVAWMLAGERTAGDPRMFDLLAGAAPHRARVLRLLLTGGQSPPRHGPRLSSLRISHR
jgi:3-methyladenine DNA glycosylase/8-oxoguanine DNA glycosylase